MRITRSTLRQIIAEEHARILAEMNMGHHEEEEEEDEGSFGHHADVERDGDIDWSQFDGFDADAVGAAFIQAGKDLTAESPEGAPTTEQLVAHMMEILTADTDAEDMDDQDDDQDDEEEEDDDEEEEEEDESALDETLHQMTYDIPSEMHDADRRAVMSAGEKLSDWLDMLGGHALARGVHKVIKQLCADLASDGEENPPTSEEIFTALPPAMQKMIPDDSRTADEWDALTTAAIADCWETETSGVADYNAPGGKRDTERELGAMGHFMSPRGGMRETGTLSESRWTRLAGILKD